MRHATEWEGTGRDATGGDAEVKCSQEARGCASGVEWAL